MEPISPGGVTAGLPGDDDRAGLSEREVEILRLVASGSSNKDIAQRLVISPNTVKVHLRNIFAKIGVASRTEAALYAIRAGLAPNPVGAPAAQAAGATEWAVPEAAPGRFENAEAGAARRPVAVWPWVAGLALLAALVTGGLLLWRVLNPPAAAPTAAAALPRWSARAPMPTAREGLAVAVYENRLYAIGGEGAAGVTGTVERYDPESDTWVGLAPKPLAVADVTAAVVGGLIFVPGGRTAMGEVSSVVEVYDPRHDVWERRSPLPHGLSGYALAAFEGRLYLFGGWDGKGYTASSYIYEPTLDKWSEAAPLPQATGYAAAAAAAGRIYVIGGRNDNGPLADAWEYAPEVDLEGLEPWRGVHDMPEARTAPAAVSVADIIHVVGDGIDGAPAQFWKYFPNRDSWEAFDAPTIGEWSAVGLGIIEANLHVVGGWRAGQPGHDHLVYRTIYTIEIPIVQ